MKKTILSIMFAAFAMCGWAASDENKTLKVKLDIVDFGDSVVVYRRGYDDLTFVGKDGKFEFELEVDTVSMCIFLQPRLLRNDMNDPRFYSIPLVGGEEVRLTDTDRKRFDVDGTGFYADYHKVDLFNENAEKESRENALKYRGMQTGNTITTEERNKFYNEVYMPSYDRYQQDLVNYIKAHPKQESSFYNFITLKQHLGNAHNIKRFLK